MVPFSILDLAPIVEGGDAAQALRNVVDVARHAERWGYNRIWYAEHHNIAGVASAATSIVIAHVAANTSKIRVGAGGIMLPNHAPLVIAEQFGTLATLHPGRIDLGIGRAPGTDHQTARALRRHLDRTAEGFPADVLELMGYLATPAENPAPPAIAGTPSRHVAVPQTAAVRAIPGTGTNVPIWILGSSLYGAQLAAELGLPYAFASHFAPTDLMPAIELYRSRFKPSPQRERPHVMLGANIIAADTDAEAQLLLTSLQQAFIQLRRNRPGPLPPPVPNFTSQLFPDELATLEQTLSCTFVGSPTTIGPALEAFITRTHPDELIITSHIHDHTARLRSFELASMLQAQSAP